MTVRTLHLSPEALAKLDRVANAGKIDAALLHHVGLTPAAALRFAVESGDIPSVRDVRSLIGAFGRTQELDKLLALAREREKAEGGVTVTALLQALAGVATMVGMVWSALDRLKARKSAGHATFEPELAEAAAEEGVAVEGEAASEA